MPDLPTTRKGIDWYSIEKGFIFKTQHDNYGYNEFEFIGYERDKYRLFLKFNNLEYNIKPCHFLNGNIGRIVGKYTDKFKIDLYSIIKDDNRDIVIISREYRRREYKPNMNGMILYNNDKYYRYKCNKCGYKDGWIEESHLLVAKRGCSCCNSKTTVLGINTIYDTDPWMMDLGVSEEDAKKYTKGSNKKIRVKCPNCGNEKKKIINDIYSNKSISCICGDGFSYPEKFMNFILAQSEVEFETQYSPDYLANKRSDFYISKYNLIIETDGILGHKGGVSFKGCEKDLAERVAIDKWKEEQHLSHGIKTIRIDCFESSVEYIKSSILNSELIEYFNFDNINWNKVDHYAYKSNKKKEVCDYRRDNPKVSAANIGKIFNLDKSTTINYLKFGNKYGWCKYNPKEEMSMNGFKNGKLLGKKIEIYKNDTLIGIEDSVRELERVSEEKYGVKLLSSKVYSLCNGEKGEYKGYIFKYTLTTKY